MNVEVDVPNPPYGLCGCKATLEKMQLCYFVIAVANIDYTHVPLVVTIIISAVGRQNIAGKVLQVA